MMQKTKNLKCKCCKKSTLHYLIGDSYRCMICNTANQTVKRKEIVFEPDGEL